MNRVVVSNGYGQFPLARLAQNLFQRGDLSALLTGAYPKDKLQCALTQVSPSGAMLRLMERRVDVPDWLVYSHWPGEFSHQIGQVLAHRDRAAQSEKFVGASLSAYTKWAGRVLAGREDASIYHFRAGMGGASLDVARSMGMTIVCDHSIVHPRLLAGLVDGTGGISANLGTLWSRVEEDLDRADRLVVNSEFVASTCRAAGSKKPIYVAYTGVDPALLSSMDNVSSADRWGKVRALFAGTLEKRKGVDTLVAAISRLSPSIAEWTLIGTWEPNVADLLSSLPAHVVHFETMPHKQLSETMATANLFVFPSRAEGSARVVAEALVSGCYVITTPNAGSITRDGIDGRIVQPGDVSGLTRAVEEYASMLPSEREVRSLETKRYAREYLSEIEYTTSVMNAYES